MIPTLHEKDARTFETLGIGALPSWIDNTVEVVEERNGEYYLQGELPKGGLHVDQLAIDRIIYAAPAPGKAPQPFRIRQISKPNDRDTVEVVAQHVSYQLTESVIVTYGEEAESLPTYETAQDALDALVHVAEPDLTGVFTFTSNIVPSSAVQFGIKGDPVSFRAALGGVEGSMIDTFGGELEWNCWTVNLLTARGRVTDKVIRYGQNLESLDFDTDVSGLVTGYVGYYRLENSGSFVLGETVLASNANDYAYPRVVAVDLTEKFEGAEYLPTTAQITAETEAYVATQPLHALSTSITVTAIPENLQDVYLCDTVTVIHPGYELQQTAKVVKTVFDPIKERYKEITLGVTKSSITNTIAQMLGGGSSSSSGGSSGSGAGGVSPIVDVTNITGGHRVAITDVIGTHTFDVMDGDDGTNGTDGVSPTVTVTDITGGHSVTITDATHPNGQTFDVLNGVNGGGSGNVVVLRRTSSGVLDGDDNPITGAQINSLALSGKVIHLYDEANSTSRLFTYRTPNTNGSALFTAPYEKQIMQVVVAQDSNTSIMTSGFYLPAVDTDDNGKVMTVVDGAWAKALHNPNFLSLDLGSDGAVRYNGELVTGAWVADKVSTWKVGACLVSSGTAHYTYYLTEIDETGLCFTRSYNNLLFTMYLPTNSSQITITVEKDVVDPYIISLTASNGVYSLASGITWAKILENINNCLLSYSGYYQLSGRYVAGNDVVLIFTRTEYVNNTRQTTSFRVVHSDQNDTVSITRTDEDAPIGRSNVYFYIDGTTVKSAETNQAVTGQQIQSTVIENGIAPIVYKYDSYYGGQIQYHFSRGDSYGLYFRRLDGKEEIKVPWNTSTVVTTTLGNNTPFHVQAVYDSSQSKYVLKKWSGLTQVNATYADLSYHMYCVWLNGQLPVHKIVATDGYIELRFIDMQITSGGVSIVQWLVQAGSSTGVTVTRDMA